MGPKDIRRELYRLNSIKLEKKNRLLLFWDFSTAQINGQMVKMTKDQHPENFDAQADQALMDFIQSRYGLEAFTPGLERTRPLYQKAIEAFRAAGTKVIIIAGTNGKGQTAHTLASLLALKGKSFALWTSPHILSIRERFVYSRDGVTEQISYFDLKRHLEITDELLNTKFPEVRFSFYEFLFKVFLSRALQDEAPEYLLLEVGLGGRLDAVNHFDADCSCITSISRDHQGLLGKTLSKILHEKIAVSRRGKPLFTQFNSEYLNDLTKEYTEKNGIDWRPLRSSVKLDYFAENQFLAWSIFSYFEPDHKLSFTQSMNAIPLFKGRREIMTFGAKSLIFIGAHNTDGIRKMLSSGSLAKENSIDKVLCGFSQRPLDEVIVMLKGLEEFFGHSKQINVSLFQHPKALTEPDLWLALKAANKGMLNFVTDWKLELQKVDAEKKAETILVCGSYYFIGEIQRFILSRS